MSNFSCKSTIQFVIERYIDKRNNISLTGEDKNYKAIPLTVVGEAYFKSGKTYGIPEDCYPDEGEVDIISAFDQSGKDWKTELTDAESESIIEMIIESADDHDNYDDDHDCYD